MVAARRIIALSVDADQRRATGEPCGAGRDYSAYLNEPSADAVARTMGVSQQTVTRCLERAAEFGVLAALDDRARTGREATITAEARTWLVGLACAKPKQFGYPHEPWTPRLLAAHARDHGPDASHASLAHWAQGTVCKIRKVARARDCPKLGAALNDSITAAKRRSRAQPGRAEWRRRAPGWYARRLNRSANCAIAGASSPSGPFCGGQECLPFGRRGGVESGLLGEPRRAILLFDLACRLVSRSVGSFRSCSLCGFARHRLASISLSFRDPDVAGRDDLRSGLYSLQPLGVFPDCPSTLDLSLLRGTGRT